MFSTPSKSLMPVITSLRNGKINLFALFFCKKSLVVSILFRTFAKTKPFRPAADRIKKGEYNMYYVIQKEMRPMGEI